AACDDRPGPSAGPAATGTTTAPDTTAAASGGTLAPTPACDDGDDPTLAQTEGPYFTPNSPQRASLVEAGMGGQRLVVAGPGVAPRRPPGGPATPPAQTPGAPPRAPPVPAPPRAGGPCTRPPPPSPPPPPATSTSRSR